MLDPTAIRAGLAPDATLPVTIYCYDQVSSTMDLTRTALATLPPEALPVLITAEEQVAGRGRLGRRWIAPPGSALLFSLGLRPPPIVATTPATLIWLATVALLETIDTTTPLKAGLKWPNDVLVQTPTGWAKTAGILLEGSWDTGRLVWAIIGCGVNVSAAPELPATLYPATALTLAGAPMIDRLHLLHTLLRRYDFWFRQLQAGETERLWQTWRSRLITLGQMVTITTGNDVIHGEAVDVDRSGTLIVREPTGIIRMVESGDVGLIGQPDQSTDHSDG
ncbi:biotin--[acetyl-CoA-carboxylase] ligase [Chloroflexus sp.]|uniref:biotin--[acetyl-CoA-carboxylase] ligase n=1 Tax=Chloroflexus sp. TaxID=1904827 RepID=UPI00261D454A|nr:biotin--[acetyl-CoA-carboxylase] ligase [uncultured Chloroflexus sp.]